MTEPRTVTVTGWLARHQVRRHLDRLGIECEEFVTQARLESVTVDGKPSISFEEYGFTFEATDEQWDGIQQAKQEAER